MAGVTVVVTLEVLLAGCGSFAPEATVAVLVNDGPLKPNGTLKVALIVTVCPGVMLPRLQGKADVQPPVLETNVRPAGVGSLTTTAAAAEGPAFVVTMA